MGEGAAGLFDPFFFFPCFRPWDVTRTPFCDKDEGEDEDDEEEVDEEEEEEDELVII